jgi:hypothetical protein
VIDVNPGPSRIRQAITFLVALAIVGTLYALSQPPRLPRAEADEIARRFRFERLPFPEPEGFPHKSVRVVHPSLSHMSAWISTLGAAVAVGDLDGDGLANDLCYVDPRIDQVVVAPAPGTPDRYAPFVLNPAPLPFDGTMAPMGSLLGDFNEDGLLDVLVYCWGRSPIIYLQQPATAPPTGKTLTSRSFVPSELVEPYAVWSSTTATHADLDGDGHCDLIVGNYGPDGILYLDGAGTGRMELMNSFSRAFNGGGTHYFLWEKGSSGKSPPHFRKADPGLDDPSSRGWTLAIGTADLDGDGMPEVYISNDFGPDRFLHNRSRPGRLRFALLEGERTLTTPRSRVLGRDSFKGMGVDFGDVNGDGHLDMFVSNLSGPWSIYESHFLWLSTGEVRRMKQGVAPYYDAGEKLGLARSGWGWDSRLGDFDNDGSLEAVQAMGFLKGTTNRWAEGQELAAMNDQLLRDPKFWPDFRPGADLGGTDHNRFYVRASDGRFYDFSERLEMSDPMVSRGIALADVDGDGRLDFAVANQWGPSYLFRNTSPRPGAFLGLHVRLPVGSEPDPKTLVYAGHPRAAKPTRPAVGAAVTVQLPDGRRLVNQVDGGSGHSGKRSHDVHFGLGDVPGSTLLRVEIRWRGPDGKLRSHGVRVAPGWHTVCLGEDSSEQETANRD